MTEYFDVEVEAARINAEDREALAYLAAGRDGARYDCTPESLVRQGLAFRYGGDPLWAEITDRGRKLLRYLREGS